MSRFSYQCLLQYVTDRSAEGGTGLVSYTVMAIMFTTSWSCSTDYSATISSKDKKLSGNLIEGPSFLLTATGTIKEEEWNHSILRRAKIGPGLMNSKKRQYRDSNQRNG